MKEEQRFMLLSALKTGSLAAAFGLWLIAGTAGAETCKPTQSFDSWRQSMKRDALAAGISRATVNSILDDVTYDPKIIGRDRAKAVFAQDFLTFSGRMVSNNRMQVGEAKLKQHRGIFTKIEQEFGVPGEVIVGFWGLETDFGANSGKSPILGALATLAYDCRRPEMFHEQMLAALKIIDRGDLTREDMVGAWAGELGQTQFLPTHYLEFGVDYDGNGHVDLKHSVPDVLASTAKLIQHYGWRKGEPWLQEVAVPDELPWHEADVTIRHPISKWAKWGVTLPGGKPLPATSSQVALLLPMGREGPAFIAYPNFDAYTQWNQSLVYATTAAYYAARLAGAPRYDKGKPGLATFSLEEMRRLQNLLAGQGYDVGDVDGIIGEKTRQAIRQVQIKYGLPADSYPSGDLMRRLQGG
jgi:lytic murein transglycosylase